MYEAAAAQYGAALDRLARAYEADPDRRRDLSQEIHLELWRSFARFDGRCSIRTWVYRVALNTALTHARRRPVHVETPLDEDHVEAADLVSLDAADDTPDLGEQSERLYAAIDRLGDVDRMLVTMYLDERSYREMAEVIGISESHVGVKLHRIKKALARSLAEEPV